MHTGSTERVLNLSASDRVVIDYPETPGSYGDNLKITWLIHVPDNKSALLEFTRFGLERGFDFLHVGFGSEPGLEETRLITLSGDERPTAGIWEKDRPIGTDGIRTRHQTSWLLFTTDSFTPTDVEGNHGFSVTVSAIDEGVDYEPERDFCDHTNVKQHGKVHLPSYKQGAAVVYLKSNTLVSYVFQAEEGACLGMYLKEFTTTDRSAILYIGDGKEVGNRDTVLHRLVDTTTQFDAFPVESTGRWMWLMFANSYKINEEQSGFKLRITEIKPNITLTPGVPYNFSYDGSAERPVPTSNVYSASWTVGAPPGTNIRIKFLKLEMDVNLDFFMIADGWTYLRYEQYRYAVSSGTCQSDTSGPRPLDDVIINLSRVFIGFYGFDEGEDSIIEVELSVVEKDDQDYPTGDHLPGDVIPVSPRNETILKSPNHPGEYPHSSIMTWIFRVPPLYHFNVHFEDFHIAEGLDKLSIGNGTAPFSSVYEVFSGGESKIDEQDTVLTDLQITKQYMWIKVESYQLAKDGSFIINITAEIDKIVLANDGSKLLMSPYYPLHYENEAYVEWEVGVSSGYGVMVHFIEFHLIDDGDTLTVEDALPGAEDSIPAIFTGVDMPSDFVLWSTEARIRFETNSEGVGAGFKIKVQPMFGEGHCLSPLGLEGGWIPDDSLYSSTLIDQQHAATHARLNGPSAWVPEPNDPAPVLTVRLKTKSYVTGVVVQSGPDSIGNWVDSFTFEFPPSDENEDQNREQRD
ncbi:uncharacterized protein LOC121432180 [Lytechinus variegatus]|uniref:uncharacterized protein LOC121432180 n=1 Tax=Lytechinus variegatus TaxID=7654 RepID=UPI001BB2B2D3|nr:uncharacterized protein LOC121432180 [Lytechinus variegatus]